MPLMSSRAGGSARAFGLTILSALTLVLETFNRSDQSGLGSVRGQRWRVLRGVWSIVGNKALSSTAAGDNALATLRFTKTDVTISVSGADPGVGAAFWVTDANNWYASVYTQTETCQTCSNCNSFSGGNCAAATPGNCNAFTPGTCNQNATGNCANGTFCCAAPTPGTCISFTCLGGFTPGNCKVFNSANTGNRNPPFGFCHAPLGFNPPTCNTSIVCANSNPPTCNAGQCCNGNFPTWSPYCAGFFNSPTCPPINFNAPVCNSFNPVVCNAFFTFSCNCTTEHRISILRSLAGTVSNISNNLFSAAIQSFRVILSGNQATIQSFSTASYTSQIGNSVVQSITSPQKTTQHGIIKSTSSFQQGTSINEFGVN
jgi:hypothetical protein